MDRYRLRVQGDLLTSQLLRLFNYSGRLVCGLDSVFLCLWSLVSRVRRGDNCELASCVVRRALPSARHAPTLPGAKPKASRGPRAEGEARKE